MATTRGFVMRIDVGRAGLVSVLVVKDDATTATFVVEDLDADPERFNERLSKLGILRDAMNRAEPVELDHHKGEAGEVIDAAARISRDALAPAGAEVEVVEGLVVSLSVHSQNRTDGEGEWHDRAQVAVLTTALEPRLVLLDLQAPERETAAQQLEMLRDAQSEGRTVRLFVDPDADPGPRIIAVSVDVQDLSFGDAEAQTVDGFVEALSLLPLDFPGGASVLTAVFAVIRFTTAPPFVGAGGAVGLHAFTPTELTFLVPRGSTAYDLFEAGLRDNNRMRVEAARWRVGRNPPEGDHDEPMEAGSTTNVPVLRMLDSAQPMKRGEAADPKNEHEVALALAVELLAPLASASRPVRVQIERSSLDRGPEEAACLTGVPSADLTPSTLRDLRIPYPAQWHGWGCFNHGVYRFQIGAPRPFRVVVDGKELCLFEAEDNGVQLAHACLEGDVEVVIEIEAWTCDDRLDIDVYRLR